MRILLPVLLLFLLPGCAARAEPRDMAVRLDDGRQMNFWCAGRAGRPAARPIVILESGWSADSRAWAQVIGPLSRNLPVCAYDRAGSGKSDAGPMPRDGPAIARDLDSALGAANIDGPYILVGHSAGGLYVRHFQALRPDSVAGMVLVDSSVEWQEARFAAVAGPGAGSLEGLRARAAECLGLAQVGPIADTPETARCRTEHPVARWAARLSELETLGGATSEGLPASLGDLPLVALTAGRGWEGAARDFWHGLHREIAARSSRGMARIVDESGHMMIREAPGAIIDAVLDVAAMAAETAMDPHEKPPAPH